MITYMILYNKYTYIRDIEFCTLHYFVGKVPAKQINLKVLA